MQVRSSGGAVGSGTRRTWIARLGAWGVAFFLLKGLAWLLVPAAVAYFGNR